MKARKNQWIVPFSLLFILLTGCSKVLDKYDLNVVDDRIWEDEGQAILYLNNLYEDNMPPMSLGANDAYSDETFSSSQAITDLLYGFFGASDIDAVQALHRDNYRLIRQINICIEGLERSSLDEEVKRPILGQALFFRAWRYWEMVKLHGGIPMVNRVQDPFLEADLNVARSRTGESVDLIVADLDLAIDYLPVEWSLDRDRGRITSGAAAAFKGRVLLNWASPLFNRGNDLSRWQRAYDANTQAVDLLGQMSVPRALHPDFSTIFTVDVLNNTEAVLYRRFDPGAGADYTSGWEGRVRPPSGGGSGSSTPTWELVQAFPMQNGKHIEDPESGYDPTYYWRDRDPRFYATVAFNGSEWEMNGREMTHQWTYIRNIHENNRSPATGFYNRKATNPEIPQENISMTGTDWHEIRYAEVLLNLAECANELDNRSEALELVGRIRQRAGIDAGDGNFGIAASVSKEDLRELIMIERQVEFAFENKRYWDLRRRLMFRNDLGRYVKKLNGTQRHGLLIEPASPWDERILDADSPYRGWRRIDTVVLFNHVDIEDAESYNSYFNTETRVLESLIGGTTQSLNYLDLYDFFAVPSSFLQSAPLVEQTNGWVNGSFDPLAQ
ncbi:RagB/SusD family nutrient uptake outer membrane protein [Flavilitoribacter nigricans]|nr:RagB/SusD family nutrient uptake outer membrane protein [Flavilitoribacter nigricans]